jgi:hypothetical protein
VGHGPLAVDGLRLDTANRRAHDARNLAMIAESLQTVGAARSIVIDEDNTVLAGNGVTEGARLAGLTRVRVVDTDGDELIAVRRRGLTAEQKRHLAMYDNRTGELSTWDLAQLRADDMQGLDLRPFFTDDERTALLALPEAGDWQAAAAGLPTTDRAGFQQMTFVLTDAQVDAVKVALAQAKTAGPFDTGNANSNGNALAHICAAYVG